MQKKRPGVSPPARSGASRFRRREVLFGAAAAGFLSACKGTPTSSGGASSTPTDDSALTPQRGGTFQTLGFRPLEHLNSLTVVTPNNDFYFHGVYDTLLSWAYKPFQDYRTEYKLVGALADSWDQPDNATYIFHLRRDVKWQDATPLTAADVKFTYEFISDTANKSPYSSYFRNVASITQPDDYTLKIQTKTPDVSFIKALQGSTQILPRHVYDRGDQFEKVAIGSGPFKVDTYNQETGVVYSANRNYWKPGKPYLDGWRILGAADDTARIAAFAAGKNDALHLTDRRQVNAVLSLVNNARVMPFIRDNAGGLFVKLDRAPFNDKRIRQIVHLAIDRREMLQTLHGGEGMINPPGINGVAKDWAISESELSKLPGWRDPKQQDFDEAKQLLSQTGLANGGLTFSISFDQTVDFVKADATVIAEQLRKLGITANLQPLESTTYLKNRTSGNYDALIDPQGGNSTPGDGVWQQVFRSGGFYNKMPIEDPQLDQLIDAQVAEFDQTKRKAMFMQIEHLLLDNVYVIPLTSDPGYLVVQPYLHGWADNMTLNVDDEDWAGTWFDQATAPKNRS
jgi:peptide/nickel transport system substrate-binding protein